MKTRNLFAIAAFALATCTLSAQDSARRFGIELSGGGSVATNKIGDATLKPGFGFEGILHYRFLPHTGLYAGWGWNKFASDASFLGNNVDFEETGYVAGLQFKHPLGSSPLSYYLRVGALYNHIETENTAGDIIHDTKHGLGLQAAAGIDIPLGTGWSLTPGIKFNSLSREITPVGSIGKMNLNYLSLRVGILKSF